MKRQRAITQIREKEKNPEKQLSDQEILSLQEKDFRLLMLKMMQDIGNTLEAKSNMWKRNSLWIILTLHKVYVLVILERCENEPYTHHSKRWSVVTGKKCGRDQLQVDKIYYAFKTVSSTTLKSLWFVCPFNQLNRFLQIYNVLTSRDIDPNIFYH